MINLKQTVHQNHSAGYSEPGVLKFMKSLSSEG